MATQKKRTLTNEQENKLWNDYYKLEEKFHTLTNHFRMKYGNSWHKEDLTKSELEKARKILKKQKKIISYL